MQLKRIIEFIVFSNLWISLGAVGVALATFFYTKTTVNLEIIMLVFFSTLFGYSLQNISKIEVYNHRSKQTIWIQSNNKLIKGIVLISFLISGFLSFYIMNLYLMIFSVPFLGLVFFYGNAFSSKLQIRNIPFFKILIISICWCWTCCALPQLLYSWFFNWDIIFIVLIYVFAITIPFDVRDMIIDKKIHTIPQFTGTKIAFLISQLSILSLFFYSFYLSNYLLSFFMIITIIVLIPSIKTKSEFYYLFLLDGLLVVFPIFIL
ncbi:hypothetical protein OAD79_00595 [Flavobacteriales bacterium]|nr:hypothetical protein [Flavobacteriales bacterium]